MKLSSIVLSLAALLGLSQQVFAADVGPVLWQSNGGGCTPTDQTVANNQYWTVTGGGRVKYKGNGTQALTFSCPVSNLNSDAWAGDGKVLRLYYQDPDGYGSDYSVVARLKSFAKYNGAYETEVCMVTSGQSGAWQSTSSACRNIDYKNKIYWVEVVIRRKSTDKIVEFNGVSLEGAIF